MLVALLSSQYARFATLAEAWLAMGATAFGVCQDGRPLVYWPAGHRLAKPSLIAPIMRGDQEVGDIRVAGLNGITFDQRLRADANMIGYMLQLEEELQLMTADLVTSQDQQLALYRLTQSMRHHVSVEETLDAVATEAIRMTKAQGGYTMFVPTSAQEPLLVQQPIALLPPDHAWRLYWQAQASEREINLSDVDAELADRGICNLLHVPIWVRGSVMAGLGLVNRSVGFGTPDIKLAKAIADQASAQIERMLLYQEMFDQTKLRTEMELARRVQLDLLPMTLPTVPGLDIYANSRPAYQVGGDFYDFIVQDGRPFIFSIGDVTGKGLSAALLMTMTRTAIHSKAQFMPYPTPEAVMRQSNEDLYNDFTRVGVFATAFVGQYEAGSGTLLYANAGHAPVIYRPRDGEAVLLRADSTAIGILPVSHCRNQRLRIGPDDLLVVATDGFTDVRDSDEDILGVDRLIEIVETLHEKSAQEIAVTLFEETDRFGQGRQQDDDQTLVVIKGAAS
ncbi:MAG TPA: SpoIIE family protein phosphatase [Chloroflexaceae bacterium]|nr:SpoIIE family protein phosphatase [Chloroflexaceae bacterium]